MGSLANCVDQDEMPQSTQFARKNDLQEPCLYLNFEIVTCNPLICTVLLKNHWDKKVKGP